MLKYAIYFITAPIMVLLMFFVYYLYGNDSNGSGWYQQLWDGNWFQWTLAVILAPIFIPLRVIMNFLYPFWEELVD